jgi:hypothetical protein
LEGALDEPRALLVLWQIGDLELLEEHAQVVLDRVEAGGTPRWRSVLLAGVAWRPPVLVGPAERDEDFPLNLGKVLDDRQERPQ